MLPMHNAPDTIFHNLNLGHQRCEMLLVCHLRSPCEFSHSHFFQTEKVRNAWRRKISPSRASRHYTGESVEKFRRDSLGSVVQDPLEDSRRNQAAPSDEDGVSHLTGGTWVESTSGVPVPKSDEMERRSCFGQVHSDARPASLLSSMAITIDWEL